MCNPETTEIVAKMVIIAIKVTWTFVFSTIPNRWCIPELICWIPRPSVVAKPNIVATTAIVSIKWPIGPFNLSPSKGYNTQRIPKGSPLL